MRVFQEYINVLKEYRLKIDAITIFWHTNNDSLHNFKEIVLDCKKCGTVLMILGFLR